MSDKYPCRLCQMTEAIAAKFPEGGNRNQVLATGLASFMTGTMEGATHMAEFMRGLCDKHANLMAAALAEFTAAMMKDTLRRAGIDVEIRNAVGVAVSVQAPTAITEKPAETKESKPAEIIPINRGPKKELN